MKIITGQSGRQWVIEDERPMLVGCHDWACEERDDYDHQGTLISGRDGETIWSHWHCGACGALVGSSHVAPRCCFDGDGRRL